MVLTLYIDDGTLNRTRESVTTTDGFKFLDEVRSRLWVFVLGGCSLIKQGVDGMKRLDGKLHHSGV